LNLEWKAVGVMGGDIDDDGKDVHMSGMRRVRRRMIRTGLSE